MSHATQPARPPVAGRPQRARIPALIIVADAAAVYLLFLAVLGYAAGFFAGRGVPTGTDQGTRAAIPVAVATGLLLLLLLLFAVQHTVMARPWFKRRWTPIVPGPAGRTSFVVAASLVLAPLFWLWRRVRPVLWSLPGPGACALRAAYAAGPGGGCQVHLSDQPCRPVRAAAGPAARAARPVPSRAIHRARRVRAHPASADGRVRDHLLVSARDDSRARAVRGHRDWLHPGRHRSRGTRPDPQPRRDLHPLSGPRARAYPPAPATVSSVQGF